jgi:VanZ family protein
LADSQGSLPAWRTGLAAWAPALLWATVIFGLSSIPGDALPRLPSGWWNADKLVHGVVYAVLGALCWRGARRTVARDRARAHQVLTAVVFTTVFGISDELHQAFTPFRSPDAFDVIADAVGGLAGALVCVAIVARRRANGASPRGNDAAARGVDG